MTVTITVPQVIPKSIVYAFSCLSGLAIAISVVFLIFNIRNRKEKIVKMSSPNLNNVIILGNILVCVFVVFMGLDTGMVDTDTYLTICKAKLWILTIGFTLAFGSMFAKTWRVYSILIHEKTKKKSIKDRHLGITVAVMLVVDVAILIVREVVDPLNVRTTTIVQPQSDDDEVALVRYLYLYVESYSKMSGVWLAILTAYKGLMLVFGSFLSWQTRNITVTGLNDSKEIALSIYNVVICCAITLPLSLLIQSDPGASYAMTAGFILFSTVITLCMLFVPKVNAIIRKKNTVGSNAEKPETAFKFNMSSANTASTNKTTETKASVSAVDG
ncbi:gamma-aminobutyric acid type B receptor subunit 2-like [Ptychodera flava]|uniref:gamma-aminobutyric acid type B receptor subunit 2-like n=1 Tax=Ptychodera flava TaxID=63121 RepID=UPI00396A115C